MKPVVISQGEPAGIGPDILLGAYQQRQALDLQPFYVRGDVALLAARARRLGADVSVSAIKHPAEAANAFEHHLPVIQTGAALADHAGAYDPADAPHVIASIEQAVDDIFKGHASAIVTAPIAKEPLLKAGFAHPGHTDFLGVLAEKHTGQQQHPVMLLWSDELAIVPLTVHVPLARVPTLITSALIEQTVMIVERDFRQLFGIEHPRIAVCGLNPHAGEAATLGVEERDIIAPALDILRAKGFNIIGPLPADTMFYSAMRQQYDVAIAMYHDQALIPIKTLAFDQAVNVTLGLPFIRTSPDHGTALSLAGTGKARITSFVEALKLAQRLAPQKIF